MNSDRIERRLQKLQHLLDMYISRKNAYQKVLQVLSYNSPKKPVYYSWTDPDEYRLERGEHTGFHDARNRVLDLNRKNEEHIQRISNKINELAKKLASDYIHGVDLNLVKL